MRILIFYGLSGSTVALGLLAFDVAVGRWAIPLIVVPAVVLVFVGGRWLIGRLRYLTRRP